MRSNALRLPERLIQLRESKNLSVPELSKMTSTPLVTIYAAEGRKSMQGREVTAPMLRKVYHGLCDNEEEWIEILLLWAIHRDGYKVSLSDMAKVANKKGKASMSNLKPTISTLESMPEKKAEMFMKMIEFSKDSDDFLPVMQGFISLIKK